jgi:serine phosphatase RsbU (regulator of sigma subunit)
LPGVDGDLAGAITLARRLAPHPDLDGSRLHLAARYRAAGGGTALGGDFYDVVPLTDGSVRAVVGDVSGHGPEKAAIAVALRFAWRAYVAAGISPLTGLVNLQSFMSAERPDPSLFVTVCDATISRDRRSLTVRLAGHPGPVLLGDGPPRALVGAPGPALGLSGLPDWCPQKFSLPERWALLFYTDGLVEGRQRGTPERLGVEGLTALVGSLRWSPARLGELADQVLEAVEGHNGGPLPDDVTLFFLAN